MRTPPWRPRRVGQAGYVCVCVLGDRLGLCALMKKIDNVFCKHLNEHWVPKEVAACEEVLAQLGVTYDKVCTCLRRLNDQPERTKLVAHILSRITSALSDSKLELWCQEYVTSLLLEKVERWSNDSLIERRRGVRKATATVGACLKDVHTHFSSILETAIRSEFVKDGITIPCVHEFAAFIDLNPFSGVLEQVIQALQEFLTHQGKVAVEVFQAELTQLENTILMHCGDFLDGETGGPHVSLESSVRLILLEHFLLPCVQAIGEKCPNVPWLSARDALFTSDRSAFNAQKQQLQEEIDGVEEVKKSLRMLC